jgi:hypothetical protein
MRAFAHGKGRFACTSQSERDRLMRSAVEIINARMTAGVAVSCRLAEMKALSPAWIRGFGNAYPVCCHWSMNALVMVLQDSGINENISYVFESGHPHEAEARDFVKIASASPELNAFYRHEGVSFLPKEDAIPLQAADLLAWEWAKCRDETLDQGIRPLRKSLRKLFEHAPKRYKVAHMEGVRLANAMDKYRKVGLEQLEEESLAKAAGQMRLR